LSHHRQPQAGLLASHPGPHPAQRPGQDGPGLREPGAALEPGRV